MTQSPSWRQLARSLVGDHVLTSRQAAALNCGDVVQRDGATVVRTVDKRAQLIERPVSNEVAGMLRSAIRDRPVDAPVLVSSLGQRVRFDQISLACRADESL